METQALEIAKLIDDRLVGASALGWQGESKDWEGQEDLYLFNMKCGLFRVEMAAMDVAGLSRLVIQKSYIEEYPRITYALFRFQTMLHDSTGMLVHYEGIQNVVDTENSEVDLLIVASGSLYLVDGKKFYPHSGLDDKMLRPHESRTAIDKRGVSKIDTPGIGKTTYLTEEMSESIMHNLYSGLKKGHLKPIVPEDELPKEYYISVTEWFWAYAERRYGCNYQPGSIGRHSN